MASTLAQQLQKIATVSVNTLSAKKQKSLHSISILYPPSHAATQDFDTIYSIAIEGYRELVELDLRFVRFENGIFSERSKAIDRVVQSREENAELDRNVDEFLGLVGSKLLVKGALKALEWLIRKFRIHEQNTTNLILTFLPYHQHAIFPRLLSTIPQELLPAALSFLLPHLRPPTSPPRSSIVKSLTSHPDFFNLLTNHVIDAIARSHTHHALISFYMTCTAEALNRLCSTATYRKHPEDIVAKVMPLLAQGLKAKKLPELQIGCYMIITVLTAKLPLGDVLLDSIMAEVTQNWTKDTLSSGLACIALLAQRKHKNTLPIQVIQGLVKVGDLDKKLSSMQQKYKVDRLATGLVIGILDNINDVNLEGIKLAQAILVGVELSGLKQTLVLKKMLEVASKGQINNLEVKDSIGAFFIKLGDETQKLALRNAYDNVLSTKDVDVEMFELQLQTVIRPLSTIEKSPEEVTITTEVTRKEDLKTTFSNILLSLPASTMEVSFLSPEPSSIFQLLLQAFNYATMSTGDEMQQLFNHSIFSKQVNEAFTLSFFIKIWASKQAVLARVAALHQASEIVSAISNRESRSSVRVDFQALIPYVLLALGDANQKVRAEAANLYVSLASNLKHVESAKKKEKSSAVKFWGFDTIFGKDSKETSDVKWMETSEARKVLKGLQTSCSLEEIVLDGGVVRRLIAQELSRAGDNMKSSLKATAMTFLSSHVLGVTDIAIRLGLLQLLNSVTGGPAAKAKNVLPLLQDWVGVVEYDIRVAQCTKEKIDVAHMEGELVQSVNESDRGEGIDFFLRIAKGDFGKNYKEVGGMRQAVLKQLQNIWPGLRGDIRILVANGLLDIGTLSDESDKEISGQAIDVLRHVEIAYDVFENWLLNSLNTLKSWRSNLEHGPTGANMKKQKWNDSGFVEISRFIGPPVSRLTTILELLENQPLTESAIKILKPGFAILGELINVSNEIEVQVAYLLQLTFLVLNEIVRHIKDSKTACKELEGIVRADVLVNCFRSTNSPQVQSRALLFIATLADIAPEAILHSVMPIFTFMGANVLPQDDEYSAYVIEQTVQRVIPPLVKSLRSQESNIPGAIRVVRGVADLVANFITAYQHIPAHRRLQLFVKLTDTLGASDFLFVVTAMLAEKYFEPCKVAVRSPLRMGGKEHEIVGFCKHVTGAFEENVQLASVVKYLDLIMDVLGLSTRGLAPVVFDLKYRSTESKVPIAAKLLHMLAAVLDNENLRIGIARKLKSNTRTEIREHFREAMERLLTLSNNYEAGSIREAILIVLKNLLNLLSTQEFVTVVETLITDPRSQFCRSTLAAFTERLNFQSRIDNPSQEAIFRLAPQIALLISSATPVELKGDALSCINVITTKFGKRDPAVISSLVEVVISEGALQSLDEGLKILALVCLTDMTAVLGGRIIPFIPKAVPYTLSILEKPAPKRDVFVLTHNAIFALMEKLVDTIPSFMASYLQRILKGAFVSAAAAADADEDTDSEFEDEESSGLFEDHDTTAELRSALLATITEKVEIKTVFSALASTWNDAVDNGYHAVRIHLLSVKKVFGVAKKTQIQKMDIQLTNFFMAAFDLRRSGQINDEELEELENLTLEAALQMVYKLNDTIFRPMFSRFLDWAVDELKETNVSGCASRLITFYKYLTILSTNLHSLVTEYFGLSLSNIVEILSQPVEDINTDAGLLWKTVLTALITSFSHDDRDFWAIPSHFQSIAPVLINQFTLSISNIPLSTAIDYLIPALSELASITHSSDAVEDTLKTFKTGIIRLMHSDDRSVKMAALKTEIAFYEKLGEEWLGLMPETLPHIAELLEDDDEEVERETQRLIRKMEEFLGRGELESMLRGGM